MSAGCAKDHYIQDAAEAYIVYVLQKLAVESGCSLTDDVQEKFDIFQDYCRERNIKDDFTKSSYKNNIDSVVEKIFGELQKKYPNEKFDFIDVEKQFRNQKLKGDFVIQFKDRIISVSLKNYKNGYERPQLCSGTWVSFLNNFIFESVGVGTFKDPTTNEVFKGSDKKKREALIDRLGLSYLKDAYSTYENVSSILKQRYVHSEDARLWSNIEKQWRDDCKNLSETAIEVTIEALSKLPNDLIKPRVLKMAGLNYDEELLLISKDRYLCSLFDEDYAKLLERVNSDQCKVEYIKNKKSILFSLTDDDGQIINIDIPFTLQKNGAWHLPKTGQYEGTMFHKKEGIELHYGERRPKKSKEIATSINTYLNLKGANVC